MLPNHNFIDLTGQKFNKLTVISRAENTKQGQAQWLCMCDCGNNTIVSSRNLKSGHVRSCGCSRIKNKKELDNLYHRICIDCNKIDKFKYYNKHSRCRSCAEKYKYKNHRSYRLIIKTDTEINGMIKLFKNGVSLDSIGKEFNIDRVTVIRILKEHYPHYSPRKNNGLKIAHDTIHKKCISGEWQKSVSARAQGIPIDQWKKFVTQESEFFYKSKEWKELRDQIFQRDNFTCQLCFKRGSKKINAHHIKKRSNFKELSLDSKNLITLCVDCHDKTKFKEILYQSIFENIIGRIYSNISV